LAYAIKVKILFRDITVIVEGFWAPFIGLVSNDIGTINGVNVKFDKDDNVLKGEDVLDDEPNLNTHGIDNIHVDLDTQDKGNNKFDLAIQCKERKKGIQIASQHLSRICDVMKVRIQ
jgi:hypothetical protein